MTAALTLARHGLRVHLVERSQRTGSLLRGVRLRGVRFDTGFHYTGFWGRGEPLDVFFRFLGIDAGAARIPLNPKGYDRVLCLDGGTIFDIPYARDRLENAYYDVFPKETKAISAFFDLIRDVCENSPILNPKCRFTPELMAEASLRQDLGSVLGRLGLSSRVRTLLSLHCMHIGCEPKEAVFADFARVAGSFYTSVHTADGGGEALATLFDTALDRHGVTTTCGVEATSIRCAADGSLQAVHLSDESEIPANIVIHTGDPRALPAMLPPSAFRPAYVKRLARLAETPSAYMLFGAAQERLESLDRRNLVILPHSNGERFFRRYETTEARPLFVSMDQSSRTLKHRGVIVLAAGDYGEVEAWENPGQARSAAYIEHKAAVAEAVASQLMEACPEFEGNVEFFASATPLGFARRLGAARGGLYGIKRSMDQAPPLPMTRVPGLYLAGQAVVCPGLLGAMSSAFLACGFVVGHETLRVRLAACA